MTTSKLCNTMLGKLNIFLTVGVILFTINSSIASAQNEPNSGSTNDGQAFWLWLEAYSDDNGNIMDPIDLSELASASQHQDHYDGDASSNTRTKAVVTESKIANNLDSETNPQLINTSVGNDEVHAQ